MEYVYAISVVVVLIALSFGVKWLQNKGVLTDNNFDLTKKLLKVVEIIVRKYTYSDEFKDKYALIDSIALSVVEYIEILATYDNNNDKKQLAFDTTIEILTKLGIELTEDDKFVLDFTIETMVDLLPPTGKIEPIIDDLTA